jgi:hypothetical protein
MDITFLSFKSFVLKLYANEYESGQFKPETIEEEAERELAEYEAEKEKAAESVVEPEIVPSEDVPLMLGGGDHGR